MQKKTPKPQTNKQKTPNRNPSEKIIANTSVPVDKGGIDYKAYT